MPLFRLRYPLLPLATAELSAMLLAPVLACVMLHVAVTSTAIVPDLTYGLVQMVAMLSMGLFSRRQRAHIEGILLRVIAGIAAGSTVLGLISFLFPSVSFERRVFVLAAPIAFLAVVLIRFVFDRLVADEVFKRRVLVFGAGVRALSIAQLRRRTDLRGFRVVAHIAAGGERLAVPRERVVTLRSTLLEYARANGVDEIVVAADDRRRGFPVHELLDCRLAGIDVTDLVDFLERETGKVRLDVLNPTWFIFSPGFRRDVLRQLSERSLDVVASLVLLFVTWPLMLLTVVAIKLEEGWRAPLIYAQTRVGFEGRHFRVLKFRSMRVNAETGGKAVWATTQDPRVTRVGALIRKVRIDELPQLINVLIGDMSFVGPRPERPEFVDELEQRIPYYRERHTVKPGLTGWAQLCYPYGSTEKDATEKLQYDLYYVKNHTLLFDLVILLQTAEVVLWGKGAR